MYTDYMYRICATLCFDLNDFNQHLVFFLFQLFPWGGGDWILGLTNTTNPLLLQNMQLDLKKHVSHVVLLNTSCLHNSPAHYAPWVQPVPLLCPNNKARHSLPAILPSLHTCPVHCPSPSALKATAWDVLFSSLLCPITSCLGAGCKGW